MSLRKETEFLKNFKLSNFFLSIFYLKKIITIINDIILKKPKLIILLFIVINFSKGYSKIDISFPAIALIVNFLLISVKNVVLELRQRRVCNLINKK